MNESLFLLYIPYLIDNYRQHAEHCHGWNNISSFVLLIQKQVQLY